MYVTTFYSADIATNIGGIELFLLSLILKNS